MNELISVNVITLTEISLTANILFNVFQNIAYCVTFNTAVTIT